MNGTIMHSKENIFGKQNVASITLEIQQGATVYRNFISYLYEAQHVSGDTPPIIRSPKLH